MADEFPTISAATVLLLRDGPRGVEVFMVVRHHQIDFASGALVFPGGKIDPADRDDALRSCCADDGALADDERALRVAAIREVFEESGVLLARSRGDRAPMDPRRVPGLTAYWRPMLLEQKLGMAALCERENLELATDALMPFAHWITPRARPKRFDTHFFLAGLPAGQEPVHDGVESVASGWYDPAETIRAADAGSRAVVFPTRMNLAKLARAPTSAQALARARDERVVTVCPEMLERDGKRFLRIPSEAGYGVSEVEVSAYRTT